MRVRQQSENAARVADFLAEQSQVAKVIYPGRKDHPQADIIARQMKGGSTLVCFELKGGKEAAFALQNALDVVLISNNLGDSKSLITHPATTTHKNLSDEARAELGISPGHRALLGRHRGQRRPDRGFRPCSEVGSGLIFQRVQNARVPWIRAFFYAGGSPVKRVRASMMRDTVV